MLDSEGEIRIHNILSDYDVPFKEEYEFDDLVSSNGNKLRFDFAVFNDDGSLDFLIEFQGRQHYVPVSRFGGKTGLSRQRYNDNLKKQYCRKHNIKLVIIPYIDQNRITYEYIMNAAGYY